MNDEQTAAQLAQEGIAALRAGDRIRARALLARAAALVPQNQNIWLWLSDAATSNYERYNHLRQVLKIDPDSEAARIAERKLNALTSLRRIT
jgi:predicted TPR repeat methyltransferase